MDNNRFYSKYKNKSNADLHKILNAPSSFQEDAVLAATQILKEREVDLSEEQTAAAKTVERKIHEIRIQTDLQESKSKASVIAKRFIALVLDILILSGISYLIGFTFIGTTLVEDSFEPFVSYFLMITYFAVMNSKLTSGSFGKRMMRIQVVDFSMNPISLGKSLLRYSVLITPYFLFIYLYEAGVNLYGIVLGLLYVYFIGLVYFIITDKVLRRSFHDLISKSLVCDKDSSISSVEYPRRLVNIYFIIAFLIITFFVGVHFSLRNSNIRLESQSNDLELSLNENMETFKVMISDIQKIEGVAEIEGINLNTTNGYTSLNITIRANSFFTTDDLLADKVYERIKGKQLKLERLDNVSIIQHVGINMTLAKYNRSEVKNFKQ